MGDVPKSPDTDRRLCEEYLAGENTRVLSERYGLRRHTVRRVLHENGIELRKPNMIHVDQKTCEEIAKAYRAGESLLNLCENYEIGPTTLQRVLSEQGVVQRQYEGRKDCTETIRNHQILQRRAEGASYRQIAAEFGLSAQRAHFICLRGY